MMKRWFLLLFLTSFGTLCAEQSVAEQEFSTEELHYKNALYERAFDPHFSSQQEGEELRTARQRQIQVREEPFRLAPRQPLQSTPPHE